MILVLSILLLCIILLILCNKQELFDTYSNHLIGIHNSGNIVDTAIQAKYTWNIRDKYGDQLYDNFYINTLNENNSNTEYDPNYPNRDINGSYLDTRFETISHTANYMPIYEPHPFITINGEQITLAQGNL